MLGTKMRTGFTCLKMEYIGDLLCTRKANFDFHKLWRICRPSELYQSPKNVLYAVVVTVIIIIIIIIIIILLQVCIFFFLVLVLKKNLNELGWTTDVRSPAETKDFFL
jgi:hypothetical protein